MVHSLQQYAREPQIQNQLLVYTAVLLLYGTGHLIRNMKVGPGWISCLRMDAFFTNLSITRDFLIFR